MEAEAPAEAAAEAPAVATDAAAPVAGKENEERKCQFTGSQSLTRDSIRRATTRTPRRMKT